MGKDYEIPSDFLEMCIDNEERTMLDEDQITKYLVSDMPTAGKEVDEVIFSLVKSAVETYIMPKLEVFFEDYFKPSAREEALRDIERETMAAIRSRE